jgi:hypothetical protein
LAALAFDYAPDSFIGVADESSGDNSSALIAAIVLECEHTVTLGYTNQRNVGLRLSISRPAVDVGTSVADFHGASGIALPALA